MNFFKATICCLFVSTFFMNMDATEQEISREYFANEVVPHLKEKAEYAFQQRNIPGAAIAIVHKEHGTFIITYGVRELGKKEEIDKDTVFRIASLSKSFTGVLAAKLVEQGKLAWEDPVKQYLPELKFQNPSFNQSLQIKHFLSQTSGFPAYCLDDELEAGVPYLELIKLVEKCAPASQPGQVYAYQNVIFSLMGEVIKNKTGLSYEDALKENIFKPLGMKKSSASHAGYLAADKKAIPHVEKNGKMIPQPTDSLYYRVAPAGGINASIADMSLWLKTYLGMKPYVASDRLLAEVQQPRVVSQERFHKIKINWAEERVKSTHYGYGIRNFNYADNVLLFHAGLLSGFGTLMAVLPEKGVGIVILMNANSSVHFSLMADFLDECLQLNYRDWVGQWLSTHASNKS